MFELNGKNVKKILLIITYAALLVFSLFNIKYVGYLFNLLKPFIIGFAIAFILNIPLSLFEKFFKKRRAKKIKDKKQKKINQNCSKSIRSISIIFSLLVFVLVIAGVLLIIIPQLVNTVDIFKENLPVAFNNTKEWILEHARNNPEIIERVKSFTPNWEELDANTTEWIKNAASGLIGVGFSLVKGVIGAIVNFIMGIIFAVYMLAQKEKLIEQFKKLIRSFLSEEKANKLFYIGNVTNTTFKSFIGGQFIEAIILGILCFICMTIFKMPYALSISVVVGLSNIIPVFGPWFGGIIGAIIILGVNPMKALWFIVLAIVLQQIDGNLIYPKVVGDRVGLPGIWVMLAVLVGGNGFGIVGMFVAVPIASVIYKLLKERVSKNGFNDKKKSKMVIEE